MNPLNNMDPRKINFIIRVLIASDFFLFFALGLITPILAVFILENIQGGSLAVIGLATSAYWLSRIFSVIPLSHLMDKISGESDEFHFMIAGSIMMSIIPLFYIFSSLPWHLYVLGILNGISHSMAVPAWRILFTNHIDRSLIGYEWSVEDVAVGIATAISASLGAFIAKAYGFDTLFIIITIFGLIGSILLLWLYQEKQLFMKSVKIAEKKLKSKALFKVDSIK